MAELTDADRAEFNAWAKPFTPGATLSDFSYRIWCAGKAAGVAAERERCEKIKALLVEARWYVWEYGSPSSYGLLATIDATISAQGAESKDVA